MIHQIACWLCSMNFTESKQRINLTNSPFQSWCQFSTCSFIWHSRGLYRYCNTLQYFSWEGRRLIVMWDNKILWKVIWEEKLHIHHEHFLKHSNFRNNKREDEFRNLFLWKYLCRMLCGSLYEHLRTLVTPILKNNCYRVKIQVAIL